MKALGAKVADSLFKLSDVIRSRLKTASGRAHACLSKDCIILEDGRIINIYGDPDHIRLASHARVRGELMTFAHGGRIDIGEWFYLGPRSMVWSSDPKGVRIGNRVLIAADVMIHDTNSHPLDPEARFAQTKAIFEQGHSKKISGIHSAPITIGDDVWIGAGARVLKGVTIGEGAVIGAGSIVTHDIAPYTVAAGNPARQIRKLKNNND